MAGSRGLRHASCVYSGSGLSGIGIVARRFGVLDSHNAEIVRSAIPFAYEPFDHPRL